jgi:secreted trypsin-like serine protease
MKFRPILQILITLAVASQGIPQNTDTSLKGSLADLESKASKGHTVKGTASDASKGKKKALDELSTALATLESQTLVVQTDPKTKRFLQDQIESITRQTATRVDLAPRIAQGFPAQLSDFPYQVSIGFSAIPSPRTAHFCGGVLIAPNWVLSGAHCFSKTVNRPQLEKQDIKIFAGSANLAKPGTRIAVKDLIRYPQYNQGNQDNDIALLELETAVPNQTPIQLLSDTDSALIAAGQKAIVSGWGDTYAGSHQGSEQLLFAFVEVVDFNACNGPDHYNQLLTSNMICAGVGNGDACQGDSGGPLVVAKQDGSHRLAGIVSEGAGCNIPKYPGVYTRVPTYISWIKDVTHLNLGP